MFYHYRRNAESKSKFCIQNVLAFILYFKTTQTRSKSTQRIFHHCNISVQYLLLLFTETNM